MRTLIVGITKYGKTTTAKSIVAGFRQLDIGGIILDPHWQYIRYCDLSTNRIIRFVKKFIYGVPLLAQTEDAQRKIARNILAAYFDAVIKAGAKVGKWNRPYFVVIDEASNFIPKREVTGKGIIRRIVKEGAKFGLITVLIDQLPQALDTQIRNQCDTWICHRLNDTAAQMAVSFSSTSPLMKGALTRLKVGHCMIGDEIIEVTKK
jgi:DNA helicase HerA-like ATPase